MRVSATLLVIVIALIAVSILPVQRTENPPFALPAFQRAFSVDSSAASRRVDLWGSEPLVWRVEPYHQDSGNRRIVQYFERGRMEQHDETGRVFHGLLASELATGQIDLGSGATIEYQPPEIAIDSGEIADQVPTYLTLSRLVEQPAPNRSGAGDRVVDWVDRGGVFQRDVTPAVVRYDEYVTETGHHLPDVTVELFRRSEFAADRWIDAFGYPISEPYWTYYRRDKDFVASLIQVFERRILVYTPTMDVDERFTVASTGRHYYQWRYGTDITPPVVGETEPEDTPDITMNEGLVATIYAQGFGTPIDLALSPTGHPLILTQDGQILGPGTRDPDAAPEELIVWADGIQGPLGIVSSGESVIVTTEDGVQWYRQQDGRGVRYDLASYRSDLQPGTLPVGNPDIDPDEHLVAVTPDPARLTALVQTDPATHELSAGDAFAATGPIQYTESGLFLAGRDVDGRAQVGLLTDGALNSSLGIPDVLATFPPGTTIPSLAVADIDRWPISATGRVFAAVEDEDEARIYALPNARPGAANEAVEIAGGLGQPNAMMFGLDGSLYVADTDLGMVIRLSPER